jgi:glycosyltransferase involved in cell wall biosynthesis
MRTVHIPRRFTRTSWGGTETAVLEITRRLRDRGVDAEIVCPDAMSGVPGEIVEGVPVRRFPYIYPYLGLSVQDRLALDRKGGNLFSIPLLRHLWERDDVDVLHLHTGKRLGGIARTVARARGIPYVVTLHGGHLAVPEEERRDLAAPTRQAWEWGKALGWAVGSRRVLRDADAILCVGRGEYDRMRAAYPASRVEHLPNGVDPRRFDGGQAERFRDRFEIPEDRRLLLVVGRLDPQKDQAAAIRALATLRRRHRDAHLVVVGPEGKPGYLPELRQLARLEGVADVITWTGGLAPDDPGLADAYAAAEFLVVPSRHEPFGIVALEAWAAARPVVAARVGGLGDLVDHGSNGLLYEPGSHDDLVATCHRLLAAPRSLRRRMGHEGRLLVRTRYSWDRAASRLHHLYVDLVQDRRREVARCA